MKLTMPEGLGVLSAVVAGILLVLGSQAAQPKPAGESDQAIRQALRKAVDEVSAMPQDGLELDFTAFTLANIAKAQIKLGDRGSALGTLRRADDAIGRFNPQKNDMETFFSLIQVPKSQREVGDIAGARTNLDRLTKLVESLGDFSKVEELRQLTGVDQPRREKHEVNPLMRSGVFVLIAAERMALGDRDEARALCRRAVAAIQPQKDILKPIALTAIGSTLSKVGDPAGARDVIDQARRVAREFTKLEDREGATPYVARAMAEIGDLEGALTLARTLGKHGRHSAFRMIVKSYTEEDNGGVEFDPGGIKIRFGAESMKVMDRTTTRQVMPKIAQAVRDSGPPLFQARMLAMIAHLQAKAGDFSGARQTVDSIPNIKRRDFPGPSDGFYEAVKPGVLALIARLQFDAGNKASASEGLHQAIALSRAIDAPEQKIVAQIVIVQKQVECGDHDGARTLLSEIIPFALKQPEPLRSRSLAMLVDSQAKAGDVSGATETTDAIRSYPGLEKYKALSVLADFYEKAGDNAKSKALLRDALHWMKAEAPADARSWMGKFRSQRVISAEMFMDVEYEIEPARIDHVRQMNALSLYSKLGELDEALRVARTMPGESRQWALSGLCRDLAYKGDVAAAVKLAESFATSQERLWAFESIASAVQDGRAIK